MTKAHGHQDRLAERPKLQAVVRNVTAANIVEFDFVYGDPDLTVELVLPAPAFRDFCNENGCLVTAADPGIGARAFALVSSRAATIVSPERHHEH